MFDDVSSTTTIQPHVKQWNMTQQQKHDNIREGLLFSSVFKYAFVVELERVNGEVIKQKQEQVEFYKGLENEASGEMMKLNEKLVSVLAENTILLVDKQDLNNQIEVMKQTQLADKKAVEAEAAKMVSERQKKLEVALKLNSEYKSEISVIQKAAAEFKALAANLARQLAKRQQQYDALVEDNQRLIAEKVELAKQVAVRDARLEELEKINKSIESLR